MLAYLKKSVEKLPFTLIKNEHKKCLFDENHYFFVPCEISDVGYSVYIIRNIPEKVPKINNLPKKRILHFSNDHMDALLKEYILSQSTNLPDDNASDDNVFSNGLIDIANEVDKLEGKLTKGLLYTGGLVALLNPVTGIGIALTAILPKIVGVASKTGLQGVSEKLKEREKRQKTTKAEEIMISDFNRIESQKIINPILKALELSLSTKEVEYDPLMAFSLDKVEFSYGNNKKLMELSCTAISAIYKKILQSEDLCQQAGLDVKDIRWLKFIEQISLEKYNK